MEFAGALRQAIQASGLTLERIRHRLGQRGLTVSVATLSYWQRGRSRPRSRVVVAALEEILQVATGTLTDLLDDPAPSAPSVRGGAGRAGLATGPAGPGDRGRAASDLWPDPDQYAYLVAQLDRSGDHRLERLSIHDVYRLDETRRSWTLSVRTVLRAAGDDIDRVVCVHRTGLAVSQTPKPCPAEDGAATDVQKQPDSEWAGREDTEQEPEPEAEILEWLGRERGGLAGQSREAAADGFEGREPPGGGPVSLDAGSIPDGGDFIDPEPVLRDFVEMRPEGDTALALDGPDHDVELGFPEDVDEDGGPGGALDGGPGGALDGGPDGGLDGALGGGPGGAELLAVRYCRPGRIRAEGGLIAFELVFDRVLAAGDTAVIEYELGPLGEAHLGDGYDRRFAHPVHDYVAIIQFEGGRLPARCYGFTADTAEAPRRRLGELWIGTSGSANLAVANVRRGIVGIEWEWQ
ncbi:helix-turn-helix domain-containing protein [Actinomadura roseirufa]|uniref:helix-turn-helix domain-containing protein n=1 Tax=Actinomadura roseirufa TaxID=2094049 RepID=UPI001040FAC1|nr:hypothetical protein [Actinomadura roseirufa]